MVNSLFTPGGLFQLHRSSKEDSDKCGQVARGAGVAHKLNEQWPNALIQQPWVTTEGSHKYRSNITEINCHRIKKY